MPRKFQMSVLRTRAIQRANMVGDDSIYDGTDPTEANGLCSETYGEIYEAVVLTGYRYFEYSSQLTSTGASYLSEPADMFSEVDTIERIVDSSGRLQRLHPLMPQERAYWAGRTGHARRFEFVDDQILLYPTPPAGEVYILRYAAQPPDLTTYADAALVDVCCPGGEAAMIWGTALKMRSKDEKDVTLAITQFEKAMGRVVDWAVNKLQQQPARTYVELDEYDDPFWRQGRYG